MKRFLVLLLAALFTLVSAQDARSLAMGGVVLPDRSAANVNPAYAASNTAGPANSVPLPIGLLNLVISEKLKVGNEVVDENGNTVTTFDILAAIDQLSYLNTFIFNLPSSPTDIDLDVDRDDSGKPVAQLGFEGGSSLSLGGVSYGNDYSLPFSGAVGGSFRIGVRPYSFVTGRAVPDADFAKLFTSGTASGRIDLGLAAEAGITVDVFYAAKLPDALLAGTEVEGATIYLGIRGAPFFGFAKADAAGTARVEVDAEEDVSYEIDGSAFTSALGVSGFGYGLVADLGAAADIPVEGATFSVGLGLRNIGFGIWSGQEYTVSGNSEEGETLEFSDPTPATRSFAAPNFGLTLNGAYSLDTAGLPPLIDAVIIAGDVGYGAGGADIQVGAESVFRVEKVRLAARAGLGYDDGFKLGIGVGVGVGSVSFDLALASHTAPFTGHQSFGVAASLGF